MFKIGDKVKVNPEVMGYDSEKEKNTIWTVIQIEDCWIYIISDYINYPLEVEADDIIHIIHT